MIHPTPHIRALAWKCTPLDVLAGWPTDRPLWMLHSGRVERRWARWSILAAPAEIHEGDKLDEGWLDPPCTAVRSEVPFAGGTLLCLRYELGRRLEPAVGPPRVSTGALVTAAICPDALVYDHLRQAWWEVGAGGPFDDPPATHDEQASFTAGTLHAESSPDDYLQHVGRVKEMIEAGDIFQANLTYRLTTPFSGSTRGFARRALTMGGAWYGAYLELPGGGVVVSMSPELFLAGDFSSGDVLTRPIKGTRPARVDPAELRQSPKDRAELAMIIDVMRNDLGRVCHYGTVEVVEARRIESHPTVHHGVGHVAGRLRSDVDLRTLLAATFPAASVTGAPKIRAMQILDDLETSPRGVYCGSIGFVSKTGSFALNVPIRTVEIVEGLLRYGVGGGIVADSEPLAELKETRDKAAVLEGALSKETRRQSTLP